MKTLRESILESIEVIELDEESTASSTTTGGVAMPDAPSFKKTKFMGHPCIETDSETYHALKQGKIPYSRWKKYVNDAGLGTELSKLYAKNKRLLIKDNKTGGMVFIK